MEFYCILIEEIWLFLMGIFRRGVFAVYRFSGLQGYLIILLIIFMCGTIKVRAYNEKPTDNLQMKRQVYMELNGFSAYKNSVEQFVDQWMCNAQ